MGRKIRLSKEKQMKPNFFVFCEGKTEMAYIKFLRSLCSRIYGARDLRNHGYTD